MQASDQGALLVDLLEALANPCYEVRRLLAMADVWREADNHVLTR